MLQSLKPSGSSSRFATQQPGGVPTFTLLECQARKILTFLVVAQVITLSPSVAMSVNPSRFQCITPTTLPSDVPSEKPIMLVL